MMPQASLTDEFLEHLRVERQMSAYTIKNYQHDLHKLKAFAEKRKLQKWSQLQIDEARLFTATLHSQRLAAKSIQRILSAARSFYHYLVKTGQAQDNPFLAVSAPKAGRKLPQTLDADQISQLLRIEAETSLDFRDKAIIELFYSSGLRVAELAAANIRDIDFDAQQIRVTGKGSKERIVPVGSLALKAIQIWLQKRQQLPAAENETKALFISSRGTRLSVRSVQTRLKYWAKKSGFDRNLYPHLLRHSFASSMLESSGELRAIQEMLGHADISTTQIYTHLDFQQLAKVYDKAHPRAKKK